MRAQQLTMFAQNDFDETLSVVYRSRLAGRAEREAADLDVVAGRARRLLGQPDRSDLRLAVGATGDRVVRHVSDRFTGDPFDAHDPFRRGFVRQPGRPGDVADRKDPFDAGLVTAFIHYNEVAFDFDAYVFQPHPFDIAAHADRQ